MRLVRFLKNYFKVVKNIFFKETNEGLTHKSQHYTVAASDGRKKTAEKDAYAKLVRTAHAHLTGVENNGQVVRLFKK